MGTKNRPAPHDCYTVAEGDEPLFTLLARDVHAPFLVRAWADMREASGEAPDKVEEARGCADSMTRWRTKSRRRPPMTDESAAQLLRRGSTVGQLLDAPQQEERETPLATDEGAVAKVASLDEVFGDLPDWSEDLADGDGAAEALAPAKESASEIAGPAANAPVIDVEGQPSPEPVKTDKRTIVADVMKLPDPETLARITKPEPVKSAKPPARLPPGATDKEVVFVGWVTLGAPGEVLLRRVCESVFEPRTMASNAPALGFATLVDFRVGNQRLLYGPSEADPSVHDFYTQDLYEYCVRGAGSRDVRAPRVAPNSAITLVVRYSGQVPDGCAFGAGFELRIALRGVAVDRRML